MKLLLQILSILRAIHWSHWTSHWKSKGETSYQDHLLFERLYTGVSEEIDTLAEKIAGIYGPESLGELSLLSDSYRFLAGHPESDLYQHAIAIEEHLQKALRSAYDRLKESGELSLGLDDYLMATASSHETNLYLLRQKLR